MATIDCETYTDLVVGHGLLAFLQSFEGRELNAEFSKVKSPAVRKRVVVLVKAIASSVPEETSETK